MEDLILLIISLVFSAFFSGMEIAFVSVNKLRLEIQTKKRAWLGKTLGNYIERPSRFIATALVGNNITLVIFGILMTKISEPKIIKYISVENGMALLVIQTLLTTIIVLVFGEFIPKVLFRLKSLFLLKTLSPVFHLFFIILKPLVSVFMFLSSVLLKTFLKDKKVVTEEMFSRNDLQYFIKEADVLQLKNEVNVDPKLLENVLELKDIRVRECMVPRTSICTVEVNTPIEELKKVFIEKGFSRVIVYKENIDQIIGYVHHFEILNNPENIRPLLIPVMLIPESMNASDLLDRFIREHKNIAWVVDEFGGTSGIVTLEDVIEEIFGEIQDEHDEGGQLEKQISAEEFLFSARLEIDYLNEKYDLNLPEGDYETLSGLILDHAEHIPTQGAKIEIPGFVFTILEGRKSRLDKIKLNLLSIANDTGSHDL